MSASCPSPKFASLHLPRLALSRPDASVPLLSLSRTISRDRVAAPPKSPVPPILVERPRSGGILIRDSPRQSPPSTTVSSSSSDTDDPAPRRPSSSTLTRASSSRPKIRFAPLPDPRRPRSDWNALSDDDPDALSDDDRPAYDDRAVAAGLATPPLDSLSPSPLLKRVSIDSLTPSADTHFMTSPEPMATSSSIKDKILRPLGLARKSKSGGAPLRKTRSLETGSQVSSSSFFPRTSSTGGLGLGLRRTRTNDSSTWSDSGFETPRPRKRVQYPPVAQRKTPLFVGTPLTTPSDLNEPTFIEWNQSDGKANDEDEDDGSGMAWLRKRRRQREELAKLEAESEKQKQHQSQLAGTIGGGQQVEENEASSSKHVKMTATPAAIASGAPSPSTKADDTTPQVESTTTDGGLVSGSGPMICSGFTEMEESDDDDDDDEEEEEEAERNNDDDDDDLDEEELRHEEQLQAEAKASQGAAAAGKEVYRDHDHVKMLMKTGRLVPREGLVRRNTEMLDVIQHHQQKQASGSGSGVGPGSGEVKFSSRPVRRSNSAMV